LSGISFWLTYGNYYYSSEWVYAQSLFWFFAIFTTPLICFLIDFVFYNLHYTFLPSNEMLFRDAEAEVITLFFNYTMIVYKIYVFQFIKLSIYLNTFISA
jgi:hypothetical protein